MPFTRIILTAVIAWFACSGQLHAQYNPPQAFTILEQGGAANVCDKQHGADNPNFNNQCCGAPGERACALDLHFNKGSLGGSAGCTDPGSNVIRYSPYDDNYYCQLPTAGPEQINLLPPEKPATRAFKFFVTSDLHFYRVTYNVDDQVNHPAHINAVIASAGLSGIPYSAVIVPGDITTGGNEDRFGAYRTLWEQGNLPGASINLPVYFGLGNHDASARGTFGADSESDAERIWDYLDERFGGLNLDTSPTGCLVGLDEGCLGFGSVAGSHNYSWDWEGVHMVMLNTWAGDTDRSYYPPRGMDGLAWLKRDLDYYVGTSRRPVILFQHYPLESIDDQDASWTTADYNSFQQVIAPYNVVGLFAGHTHTLGFSSKSGAVNLTATTPFESPGTQLDSFNDGAGGDCSKAGNSQSPCGDATSNFLSVQVTDHYMEVTAYSWKGAEDSYEDNSIGMINGSATCRKRLDANYNQISGTLNDPGKVSSSIDATNNTITVTNNTRAAIPGAIVVQLPMGATTGSFVDSCDPNAGSNYLDVTENGLAAHQSITVPFTPSEGLTTGYQPLIYALSDTIVISNNTPTIGNTPVTLHLTSGSGEPIAFSLYPPVLLDGSPVWLHVSANQLVTPATITLKADSLASYKELTLPFIIFPTDPSVPPLTINVSLAATFAATTNVRNATILQNGNSVSLPATSTLSPDTSVPLSVPSPQYASGAMYTFDHWSDGLGQQHSVTVPLGGLNLELFMDAFYTITPTITPAAGGTVTISTTPNSGYYPAGDTLFHAAAAAGYYFAGYSGGFSGTSVDADVTLGGPLQFTAAFAQDPSVVINTDVPVGQGATVTVGGTAYANSDKQALAPGVTLQIAVPNYVYPGGSGGTGRNTTTLRYAFVQWSDGNTNLSRGITSTTANQTLTAHYVVQYLVKLAASPADEGSVPDSTWYNTGATATIQAVAGNGFKFTGFTGDVTSSSNPLNFTVQGTASITANFAASGTANIYAANGGAGSDGVSGGQSVRMLPISLTNAGTGGAASVQIDSITNIQVVSGSGSVSEAQPAATLFGDLSPGQSTTGTMLFTWPATATRVRMAVNFSANGGAYKNSTILTLFR